MFEFNSTISGIPCIIRVIHYDKYIPASVSGLPEESYPAEGGTSDWIVLDRRGHRARWLEKKLTRNDLDRIDEEVMDRMENLCEEE